MPRVGIVDLVTDYPERDLASAEVKNALFEQLPDGWSIVQTSVQNFETIPAGFAVWQLAAQSSRKGLRRIVFCNVAPRQDRAAKRADNDGESLLYAKLKNGNELLVVHSGHALSLVRSEIQELWSLNIPSKGSQFRSRDIFPEAVGRIARGDSQGLLRDRLDPMAIIESIPHGVVGYVDNFGNIKTTYSAGDDFVKGLTDGSRVLIEIGNHQLSAYVVTGSFNVQAGETAFAPGSSGPVGNRAMEIFRRGQSAWEDLKRPPFGAKITITAI